MIGLCAGGRSEQVPKDPGRTRTSAYLFPGRPGCVTVRLVSENPYGVSAEMESTCPIHTDLRNRYCWLSLLGDRIYRQNANDSSPVTRLTVSKSYF